MLASKPRLCLGDTELLRVVRPQPIGEGLLAAGRVDPAQNDGARHGDEGAQQRYAQQPVMPLPGAAPK